MFPLYVPFDKSDNIFGLFRHVYVFARLWGYVSFSVNFNAIPLPNNVKVSVVNRLLLFVQLSAYVSCLILALSYHISNTGSISVLVIHGLHIVNEFGIFCGILFMLADVLNSNRIWKIFRTFLHFDREVWRWISVG